VEALQSFQISIPLASQLNLASSLAMCFLAINPHERIKCRREKAKELRMELQITTQFPVSSIEAVTINWSCHN
jgi:hypothetical protein